MRLTGSKGATLLFAFLGRLAHVPPPSADWNFVRRPSFDNAIGELAFERRAANVTLRRSAREREDAERLQLLHATELSTD